MLVFDTTMVIINVLVTLGLLPVIIRIMRLMAPPIIEELCKLWSEIKTASRHFKAAGNDCTDKCPCCCLNSDCIIRRLIAVSYCMYACTGLSRKAGEIRLKKLKRMGIIIERPSRNSKCALSQDLLSKLTKAAKKVSS